MRAFIDSFSGFIKCKVLGWHEQRGKIVVRVDKTSECDHYKPDSLMVLPTYRVVPASRLIDGEYSQFIQPYDWNFYNLTKWLPDEPEDKGEA